MENKFIETWFSILRNCSYDNTYKMAWAKAIVEISLEYDIKGTDPNTSIEIKFEQIAQLVTKYYWNQTIYFDLVQGSNPLKPPKILSITKELIDKYQGICGSFQPIRYERAINIIQRNDILTKHYSKSIKKIVHVLKADVSYRFLNLAGNKLDIIYDYKPGDSSFFIKISNMKELKENAQQIFDIINYRWALILETFNSTPRICKKVKIIDEKNIQRKSLNRYVKYLDVSNPEHDCFICGKKISRESLSIDHVIPWSYLYSDDLWNLVYTHKECNSSKRNILPSEESIRKLEIRNQQLSLHTDNLYSDKIVQELHTAIEKNYLYKFWIACQG